MLSRSVVLAIFLFLAGELIATFLLAPERPTSLHVFFVSIVCLILTLLLPRRSTYAALWGPSEASAVCSPQPAKFPNEPNALWEEYPGQTSVWGGWKQGDGEHCRFKWCDWFSSLPRDERKSYLMRHPPPADDWIDWLEQFER